MTAEVAGSHWLEKIVEKAARSKKGSVVSSSRSKAEDLVSAIVVTILDQMEVHGLVTYDVVQGHWCCGCIVNPEDVG